MSTPSTSKTVYLDSFIEMYHGNLSENKKIKGVLVRTNHSIDTFVVNYKDDKIFVYMINKYTEYPYDHGVPLMCLDTGQLIIISKTNAELIGIYNGKELIVEIDDDTLIYYFDNKDNYDKIMKSIIKYTQLHRNNFVGKLDKAKIQTPFERPNCMTADKVLVGEMFVLKEEYDSMVNGDIKTMLNEIYKTEDGYTKSNGEKIKIDETKIYCLILKNNLVGYSENAFIEKT